MVDLAPFCFHSGRHWSPSGLPLPRLHRAAQNENSNCRWAAVSDLNSNNGRMNAWNNLVKSAELCEIQHRALLSVSLDTRLTLTSLLFSAIMKCTRPPGPLDCHSCHSPNSPKLRRYSTPSGRRHSVNACLATIGIARPEFLIVARQTPPPHARTAPVRCWSTPSAAPAPACCLPIPCSSASSCPAPAAPSTPAAPAPAKPPGAAAGCPRHSPCHCAESGRPPVARRRQ